MDLEDYCVICGKYTPEGSWVCPLCIKNINSNKKSIPEKKKSLFLNNVLKYKSINLNKSSLMLE